MNKLNTGFIINDAIIPILPAPGDDKYHGDFPPMYFPYAYKAKHISKPIIAEDNPPNLLTRLENKLLAKGTEEKCPDGTPGYS